MLIRRSKNWRTLKDVAPAEVVYRFAQTHGITPLSGTTDEEHMRVDVAVQDIDIDTETEKALKKLAAWMGLK